MTDAVAIPINLFENDRELMVVTPMPGVAPEDISVDVTADGALTLRAQQIGRATGLGGVDHVIHPCSDHQRRHRDPLRLDRHAQHPLAPSAS